MSGVIVKPMFETAAAADWAVVPSSAAGLFMAK